MQLPEQPMLSWPLVGTFLARTSDPKLISAKDFVIITAFNRELEFDTTTNRTDYTTAFLQPLFGWPGLHCAWVADKWSWRGGLAESVRSQNRPFRASREECHLFVYGGRAEPARAFRF